jgi:predicted GNAT family N-acyltransferase
MKISIKRVGIEAAPVVQKIYEASPTYFRVVDGSDVHSGFAERDILDCVPKEKQTASYEKIFCLIFLDHKRIGVLDLHDHHPSKEIVYLGLMILDEKEQKMGLGRKSFEAAESFIRSELKSKKIRLGVAEQNNVEMFWHKMGFKRTGTSYIWKGENQENHVFEMEKEL